MIAQVSGPLLCIIDVIANSIYMHFFRYNVEVSHLPRFCICEHKKKDASRNRILGRGLD
jgi:hypothetical protein